MTSRRAALLARQARFQDALERPELRAPTAPRTAPASPVSMPVKVVDQVTRDLIDAALAAREPRP